MAYIIRRVLTAVPVVLVVSFVAFGMVFLSGDPATLMMPPEATKEEIAAFRRANGFDDPFVVQYGRFLSRAVQGDLGKSIRYNQPALHLVIERLPATLQLSGFSILLATLISLPLGILAALYRNSIVDYVASVLAVIGQAMPNYWLGFLLVFAMAVRLHLLPTSG